ncbi:MAG: hypothetical protein ACOCWS_01960 [Alkalispirochaetaceae bacterium]
MTHRRRLWFVLILAALVLTPAFLSAQSASATLTLTGEVPSIVRIGFGGIGDDGTLALGDLNADAPDGVTGTDTAVVYVANVDFNLSVSSENGSALVRQGGDVTGFKNEVSYTFSWDGSPVNLPSGGASVEVAGDVAPGVYSATPIGVTVEPLAIEGFGAGSTLEDIEAAGEYEDVLTFMIEAAN